MRITLAFVAILLVAACSGNNSPNLAPTPISADVLQAQAPQGVLPDSPYPSHYALDLTLDPREARFSGTVTIMLRFDAPAQGFFLHGRDIDVSRVRARQGDGEISTGQWQNVLSSGVAWVELGQQVQAGDVRVELDYSAPFDVNLSGLFKVTEQGDAYALAKSESIQARRFMPGFDQPAFKAPFDITLTIPQSDTAISNAPIAEVTELASDLKQVRFATTRPLPTYLLSLAVGSFDEVDAGFIPPNEIRAEPIPLKGYARRGKGSELAFALETAVPLVEVFERALRQPYPYKKLDIIAAPQWPSGATELAAAITYRESRILAGPDIGPAARRSLLAIHAHEVGHMWFGNLVTPPWWDDLWLKEAFASWGEGASLSEIYPIEGFELDAIQDGIRAMSLDSLAAARAVREPIRLNENVRNAYDAITYNKGLAVIGMVDSYFGADVFRPALGAYVEAYEDGVADSPDFFEIIGEVTGEPDLTRAFRSFVEQNGLPLITAAVAESRDELTVTQSRFVPLGSGLENDRSWTIPYCMRVGFTSGATARICDMLDEPTTNIMVTESAAAAEVAWVLPNADGVGYWRFSLSRHLWEQLVEPFARFSAGEQLSVIDSVSAALMNGTVSPDLYMHFIELAAQSPERRVVNAAMQSYRRLEPSLMTDPAALDAYRSFASETFYPLYARLAALDVIGDSSDEQQILRTLLERFLITVAQDPTVRQNLADAAAAYIGLDGVSSSRQLSNDEFASALAVGMQTYGAPFLTQLLVAREAIDDPVFEQSVAYAIGQNKEPQLTPQILDLAFAGTLGSRESYTLMTGQMRHKETRSIAWERLQNDFATFLEVIPRQRRRATPSLGSYICTELERARWDALYQTYGYLVEGHERALSQTLERIDLCVATRDQIGPTLSTFLRSY